MKKLLLSLFVLSCLVGCIEPPLNLPDDNEYRMDVTISTDTMPSTPYADYPAPTYFEVRRYFSSTYVGGDMQNIESSTIFNPAFSRDASEGSHNILVWSDIDSPDGTQVVTINENDSICASTSTAQGGGGLSITTGNDSLGVKSIRNEPEMFYSGQTGTFTITHDTLDFNRLDVATNTYIKDIPVLLRPVVYGYRVEIEFINNDGHINGTTGDAVLGAMAEGVCLTSGRTLSSPCGVAFNTVWKKDTTTQTGKVDMVSGNLTTYGLCSMPPYVVGESRQFNGGRTDLKNCVFFTLTFTNKQQRTYYVDVTRQVRAQSRGGLIRITLDASKIPIPDNPNPGGDGAGFGPVVDDFGEDVIWEGTI